MRYYQLTITNNAGQVYQLTPAGGFTLGSGGSTFSSLDSRGNTLPGALNIEFDFPLTRYDSFQGGWIIRIWGVGLAAIGQASDLSGQNFQLSAGMAKGLPLANPQQAGLIAQGTILQGFGNWQGTEQTIDLICYPGGVFPSNGVSFNWNPGVSLAATLFSTLSQAFPQYKANVNIISNMQPPHMATQAACYSSLQTFSEYLREMTQPIGAQVTGKDDYSGVLIAIKGTTIYAYDSASPPPTNQLQFQDLIGQPTWIATAQINFKTVLRADIAVGNLVHFPQGIVPAYVLTTQGAALPNAPSRNKNAFQGSFLIQEAHHFASFRQSDAESWNTTYVAVVLDA